MRRGMMRSLFLSILVLCAFVSLSRAFTKEDHEIFRLKDEVEASEGPEVSFYDFLGVGSSATVEDISKAFKKKSRTLHPDKVRHNFIASKSTPKPKKPGEKRKPGTHVSKGPSQREIQKAVTNADERYRRLGVVASVLKGPQRERYDHFVRHGFPAWRGTGYYYSRYRPGFGTVLVGLFLVGGGGAHYLALITSYKRQREFMERYIKHARKMAWGDESGIIGIPGFSSPAEPQEPTPEPDPAANLNRKQRREMERQNKGKNGRTSKPESTKPEAISAPTGQKRRVTAENGKILVVDSIGNVFLEEEDEDGNVDEFLLDLDEIHKPTIRDTAVIKLPIWLYGKAFDPFLKSTTPVASDDVPPTESEKAKHEEVVEEKGNGKQLEVDVPTSMSSSQMSEGFEMVDSTGVEDENVGSGKAKKRKQKGKK